MARCNPDERRSLYGEVTARIIAELEQGRLPWVQPWDSAACGCTMPRNASTGRSYSGINVLILWAAVVEGGYASQRWLTFRQALALGGHVRRGEKGIAATGADFRIGGDMAFYSPSHDFVAVPPQQAYPEQINFYRTALHELGHWTGHPRRLDRDQSGGFGSAAYAREELVAELASAFTCASLSIRPTVRHADYVGAWLAVLREDEKAIFRAASLASKAADYLLAFAPQDARS